MPATIPNNRVSADEHEALTRLLSIGARDTGQSRRVADFLLAWWNAGSCGSFDLTTLWGLDSEILRDMAIVFNMIGRCREYPDRLGYGEAFVKVVHAWRPELKD